MQVIDFINNHDDWEELLAQPPYCVTVKKDCEYSILKYRQFDSDFSNSIVQECRGIVIRKDQNGQYVCVCRAFDKFGNHGEDYAAPIDWKTARVEEKVDGSLIKFWYDNNEWRVSTNGTIDAFKAIVDDLGLTFGDLVVRALGGINKFTDFLSGLEHDITYMFELVSPESRTTILYPETKLYYLGQRDMRDMHEHKNYNEHMQNFGVLQPQLYPLHDIESCISAVKVMTADEEGFVIRDKHFNRVKLKSPEFLMHFHAINNGVITTKRIIRMIQNEQIDDFLAYCPQYKDRVAGVYEWIMELAYNLEETWVWAKQHHTLGKKEFVQLVHTSGMPKFPHVTYVLMMYDNKGSNAVDFVLSQPARKLVGMMKKENVRWEPILA